MYFDIEKAIFQILNYFVLKIILFWGSDFNNFFFSTRYFILPSEIYTPSVVQFTVT